MRPVKRALICLLLVGTCLSTGLSPATAAPRSAKSAPTTAPPSDETVRARAEKLLAQMTPEEKAGQLSQYFYFPDSPPLRDPVDKWVAAGEVGSLLFVTDPVQVNRVQKIAVEQTRLKIPILFGFDVVHGLRTIFPAPLGMAASWDPALVEQAQSVAAAESRAVGVNWTFAPMVDVARDMRWGRLFEGAGEDVYLGSAMAAAQVRGFQGPYLGAPNHIMAGPKHFAAYGAGLGGRDYDEVNVSEEQLRNVYLPPFKAAIDAGAGNIMSAYMGVNGVPASGNKWLLTDILRDELGFKGFVVSDASAVKNLATHHFAKDDEDAAVRALNAGVDMEMGPVPGKAVMSNLPKALANGKITQAQLDNAVRLVLEAKIRLGLFEHPYVDETKAEAILNDPKHLALARIAAERSAVLLRNEGSVLPLSRDKIKSIAVIGPLADSRTDTLGSWSFEQNKPPSVTVLEGLKAKLGPAVRVEYSEGVRVGKRAFASPFEALLKYVKPIPLDETAEIQRAVGLANGADATVLVLGEGQLMSGEAASRSSFDLPGRQQELLEAVLATGKPVILVLMSVRPIDLKDAKIPAILDVWYPGSEGGHAVANLLMGDANPGGKLPINWLRDVAQSPNPYARLTSHEPDKAEKRYWNETSAPTYPFGHGLSYTTFQYANLRIDKPQVAVNQPVTVTIDLKNTGERAGDEVAQLYIHQRYGSSARPVRLLKGFQRVNLKPGETRSVSFVLKPEDLGYWSAASRSWVQDAAPFDVWVGGDSKAKLAGKFEVTAGQ